MCYHQTMEKATVIQGRETTTSDIELVRKLITDNPDWNRTRLSKELCRLWNWRNQAGRLKDMACRSFLLKLEKQGHITLPKAHSPSGAAKKKILFVEHNTTPVETTLKELLPVTVRPAEKDELDLYHFLLNRYHYLGYNLTVGQNIKYMAFDRTERPLSCLLFGSAAWKCADRDSFIGWSPQTREKNINLITNNMRFLILPWVKVPYLASHVLSQAARRINKDWLLKYGHSVYLLETFVEQERFPGTCYRAANWIYAGQTTGRSRNDRYSTLKVPLKAVYLYPLAKGFREVLSSEI